MGKRFIAVRAVDEDVFRKFKALSIQERLRLGDALTKAMKILLEQKEKRKELDVSNLLKMKPVKIGRKVRWSEEIDEILYGLEK